MSVYVSVSHSFSSLIHKYHFFNIEMKLGRKYILSLFQGCLGTKPEPAEIHSGNPRDVSIGIHARTLGFEI